MASDALDDIDRGILHLLQEDARTHSAADIADHVEVTANTVRNRIDHLESRGVIQGYLPLIDYEQAGFQLEIDMVCTASITDCSTIADEALNIEGVVHVREQMTGRRNVIVTAIASEGEELTAVASELDRLGLSIEAEELVKNDHVQPFDHFGLAAIQE